MGSARTVLFYESQGFRLGYEEVGDGPPLILVHGWGAAGWEWRQEGWVDSLGKDRRLLIPDVLGHGSSAKPHDLAPYSTTRLGGDMVALLDAVGVERADILGYSMGAAIALAAVVVAPDQVGALIAGGIPPEDASDRVAIARGLRGEGALSDRARSYRDWAAGWPDNDLHALSLSMEAGCSPPDCSELALYGGEALIVAGTRDWRREATERIAGCLPGGRFLAVDGADHMAAFHDARFKAAVTAFLDEVSPV